MSDEDLNRRFYAEPPSDYFTPRLANLIWHEERWDDLRALLETPSKLGIVQLGGFDAMDENDAEETRDRFVATESMVLLHHIAEALVRLFLAHRDLPAVPWIELAALTSFREYRSRLESDIIDNRDLHTSVEAVFLHGVEDDVPVELAQGFYTALLRKLTHRLLDEGRAYNSAKHGLAVRGGHTSLTVTPRGLEDTPGASLGLGHGPAVEHLEWEPVPDGRLWKITTRWVDVARNVALAYLALQAINTLWTVARARYLGQVEPGIWLPSVSLEEMLPPRRSGAGTSMSWNLGVEHT